MALENLHIPKTAHTPEVLMRINGVFQISGMSFPKNAKDFYATVLTWLKLYLTDNAMPKEISLEFNLSYFNVSTSFYLLEIIDLLNDYKDNFSIIVDWHYCKACHSSFEVANKLQIEFSDLIINLKPSEES